MFHLLISHGLFLSCTIFNRGLIYWQCIFVDTNKILFLVQTLTSSWQPPLATSYAVGLLMGNKVASLYLISFELHTFSFLLLLFMIDIESTVVNGPLVSSLF